MVTTKISSKSSLSRSVGLFFLALGACACESIICELGLPLLVWKIFINVGNGNLQHGVSARGRTIWPEFLLSEL
jgi:hypothetical protein